LYFLQDLIFPQRRSFLNQQKRQFLPEIEILMKISNLKTKENKFTKFHDNLKILIFYKN